VKLPLNPRILCISDPDFANKPYPYVFGCVPNKIELISSAFLNINPNHATLESFKKSIINFKPDLIFGFIQPLDQQRKIAEFLDEYHPVPAINWSLEDPNQIISPEVSYTMLDASASFDMWFCNDSKMVPFWKTKAAFMPPGFDESVYDDFRVDRVFDISYVGNITSENKKMYWPYLKVLAKYKKKAAMCINRPMGLPLLPEPLERLLRSKRNRHFLQSLPFWQCYWMNPANEHDKALLINKSKIHWGMNRLKGTRDWHSSLINFLPNYPLDKHGLFYQLKGRIFHAVGAGALALNEYCPELEDFFEIGKEIITFEFGEIEDLREKIAWYVTHDNVRKEIAKAGYLRGRKQHTFTERIQQILNIVRERL
jgi:spore maturation protein CgeB